MTRLLDELRSLIAEDGPLSVEHYMALALGHPRYGYYMTRDPFGAAGDFTTAPEISQMFGELLGLWAAEVWHAMGRPAPVRLIELGPGRGTLMADALRAIRALPPFRAALDIHLVETSPVLRAAQETVLTAQGATATWHATVETVPAGPALILANEFFDALPVRQFVRTSSGLHERLVGLDAEGALAFGLSPEPIDLPVFKGPAQSAREPSWSQVLEAGLVGQDVMRILAGRVAAQGGALLAIDYGHADSSCAETLQAVKHHRFVDPLAEPGEADLTAHVDFAALARVAAGQGASIHGQVPQGAFLQALGLAQRAAALSRNATPAQAAAIETAIARLTGADPGMGDLFKVLAVTHPALPPPPGFFSGVTP